MKILMTTDTIGGVWSYACELTRALAPHDVSVVLATMGRRLSRAQRDDLRALTNVEVHESDFRLEWMQDPWDDVHAAGDWLLHLANRAQPDIFHLNNYCHGALPWERPVLIVAHSCVSSWIRAVRGVDAGPEWSRYRNEVRAGLAAADLVVAPTRTMLNDAERHYGPFAKSRVVPNARGGASYRLGPKHSHILAAGRIWDEAKNIAALARIARRLSWPVRVAGDNVHPEGGVSDFADVELMGLQSTERMAAAFAAASIFTHPARYEPFGLTPLEAALSGCALVLSDIPSLREVWRDAACFVPPDDDDALAGALNALIDNPELRLQFAQRARSRAGEFTPERMAADYLETYRELLRIDLGRKRKEPSACAS